DAVFAGHAATEVDALGKNLVARVQYLLNLRRIALIEHEDWMNISVAGVEHVADAKPVLTCGGLNVPHDFGEFRSRYDAVLRAVARIAEAPDCAERLLPRFPQRHALGFGVGFADFARLVPLRDPLDPVSFFLKPGREPIHFHDDDGFRVEREAELER